MVWLYYLLGAVALIAAIILIIVVILQEGNSKGVGVVSGGADTFFSKNKARSIDAFLSRWTKYIAIGFFLIILAINVVAYFANNGNSPQVIDTQTISTSDEATVDEVTADEA